MIRVAAVADVHFGTDSRGRLRPQLEHLPERADVFLLAGDLTRVGAREEAAVLADELAGLDVPIVAVLGNHDHHGDQADAVVKEMEAVGVHVLEGTSVTLDCEGVSLGIAGVKGFGGGFEGASGSDFGEPEMKAFIAHTRTIADGLREQLAALDTDVRVALMHYAPVPDTLVGERLEIYPFMGSYLLAEAVDAAGADLIVHGHAHGGSEKGVTAGGVHVRNVAAPVIKQAYALYCLGAEGEPGCPTPTA